MADILQITLPDGTTYNIKDNNALPLTGGQVTGPVTFGDSVSIDDLTAGNVVITGALSVVQGLPWSSITNTPTTLAGYGITDANFLPLSGGTLTGLLTVVGNASTAFNDYGIHFTNNSRIGENSNGGLGVYSPERIYIRPGSSTAASSYGLEVATSGITVGNSDIIFSVGSAANTANGISFKKNSTITGHMGMDNATTPVLGIYSTGKIGIRPGTGSIVTTDGITISTTDILPKKNNTMDIGSSSATFKNIYASYFYGDGSHLTNLPTTYWANLATTSAAAYDKAPEVASVKIGNGTTATATKAVTLQYNTTTEALDFIFM